MGDTEKQNLVDQGIGKHVNDRKGCITPTKKSVHGRGARIEAEQCRLGIPQLLCLLFPTLTIIPMLPLCPQIKSHLLTIARINIHYLALIYHSIT